MKKQTHYYTYPLALYLFTLCWLPLQAQALKPDLPKVTSEITAATVYRNNAKITRKATVNLAEGTSEIVLSNLSSDVDVNSLQVNMNNNVILLSATYQINYLEPQIDQEESKSLNDSISAIDYELRWIDNQKEVFQEAEELIDENREIYSDEYDVQVAELRKLSDLYQEKVLAIRKKLLDLDKKRTELQKKRNLWYLQFQQVSGGGERKSTGEIVLQLSTEKATTTDIEFSYVVSQAGWTPLYDLRSDGLDQPIALTYKANVYQNTGYDWKDIALAISTGNPNRDNSRPILYPSYVNFYTPSSRSSAIEKEEETKYNSMSMMRGGSEPIVYSDDGVQMMSGANMRNDVQPILEEEVTDEEMDILLSVDANQLNVEFVIETPYRIPSDGKKHLVNIKTDEVATTYTYHTVPKLQKAAFLLAQITNWGELNLLKGKANLFFEGAYIGQADINPQTIADTLLLSLGRDDNFAIKRTILKDLNTKKVFGKNQMETKAYEIIVRNNKTTAVNIEVLDQIPLSKNGEIDVKLIEAKGAAYTEDYGKVFWKFPLKAGATKRLKLIYQIKYPKNKVIVDN